MEVTLAKEWEKFQAEHKKLQDGIKKYALSEAEKLKKKILDTIKKFDNLHSMSERKIRGTATTIKIATR